MLVVAVRLALSTPLFVSLLRTQVRYFHNDRFEWTGEARAVRILIGSYSKASSTCVSGAQTRCRTESKLTDCSSEATSGDTTGYGYHIFISLLQIAWRGTYQVGYILNNA